MGDTTCPTCTTTGDSPDAGAPADQDGTASAGHPVDVVTGAVFTTPSRDFMLPGFLPVEWMRTYRSSAIALDHGMGRGWSHPFAWTAEVHGDHWVVQSPEGARTAVEAPRGRGSEGGARLPFGARISRRGDALELAGKDGLARTLRRSPDGIYRLTSLTNAAGHVVRIGWTGDHVTRMLDSAGRLATATHEDGVCTWTAVAGGPRGTVSRTLARYEIDARGDLVRVTDSRGRTTEYAYEDHYVVRETRADKTVFRFVYAESVGRRRCKETWGEVAQHREHLALRDVGSRPARGIYHTQLAYGPGPYDTVVTDGAGDVHVYEGSPAGVVTRYVDPRGLEKHYDYAADGTLVAVRDALGRTTTEAKDEIAGAPRGAPAAPAANASVRFDDAGNAIFVEDSRGRAWSVAYDPFGVPVSLADAGGGTTTLTYDAFQNLVARRGPEGETRYTLDAMKRVQVVHYSSGARAEYTFVADAVARVRFSDGSEWSATYDGMLRPMSIQNPAGETHVVRSLEHGNVEMQSTFAGLSQLVRKDPAGRVAHVLRPDGASVTFAYDAAGRLAERRYPSGVVERFERDAAGRLLVAERTSDRAHVRVMWMRDARGRVTREAQVTSDWVFVVDYARDDAGNIVKRSYSTGWSITCVRGRGGRATSIEALSDRARATLDFAYDRPGREIGRRWRGTPYELVTARDAGGLPMRTALVAGGRELRARAYEWSAEGPVARVIDRELGTRTYGLDALGRPALVRGLGEERVYAYSRQGTVATRPLGAPPGASDASHEAALGPGGRPSRAGLDQVLAWDECGRLSARIAQEPARSWRYVWDERDLLVFALRGDGRRVAYTYDALGRRISETIDGKTTWFGWDHDTAVEEQGASRARTLRRVFADDGYTPLLESTETGDFRLVVADAAATPWHYVARDGASADVDLTATGEVAQQRGDAGTLRFAGQRADAATGLAYQRYRYYAPDLGLFLSPDPLGLAGSSQDVGFVFNPTYCVDPLGLWTAILQGPDYAGDSTIRRAAAADQASIPGSRIVSSADMGPGSLAGADRVIVDAHGAPGALMWGQPGKIIDGNELGAQMKNAGFVGGANQPITLGACNGGTEPKANELGNSTAQELANTTGSPVRGAAADTNGVLQGASNADRARSQTGLSLEPITQSDVGRKLTADEGSGSSGLVGPSGTVTQIPSTMAGKSIPQSYVGSSMAVQVIPGDVEQPVVNPTTARSIVVGGKWQDFTPKAP
jgi:RHS repeat-associated protein